LGLYETDVHFYMTFFLARTAGIGYREAFTIASASQYIDENPLTWPVDDKNQTSNILSPAARNRLASYHFTTSPRDFVARTDFDPPRSAFELIAYVASRGAYDLPSYVNRRYLNPLNDQLTRLEKTVSAAPTACARAQFFGEYLHAYEDTFSHRNQVNDPIQLNAGFGHGAWGHSLDKTYNHEVTFADVASRPGLEKMTMAAVGTWSQNEARTLEMETQVFQKLLGYGKGRGINEVTGNFINFGLDLRSFLQNWNKKTSDRDKVLDLAWKLEELGLGTLPDFDLGCAQAMREAYLWKLDALPEKYDGAILQPTKGSRDAAMGKLKAECGN
jgi:hypothetical protein